MNPIRFGAAGRRLFGLYLPPSGEATRNESILLCNPFGQEAIRSHRLFRALGDRLSRSGFHVMRFDYFGTGDSDGDDDAGDIDTWKSDIVRASSELTKLSGTGRVAWIGVRLGATLCAMASSATPRVPEKLLLWDPVVQGTKYLQLLESAHSDGLKADYGERWDNEADLRELATSSAGTEVLGFPMGVAMREELSSITLASFAGCRVPHIGVFATGDDRDALSLAVQCRGYGAAVQEYKIKTEIRWATNEAMNSSIVPAETLQAITSSLIDKS